MGMNNPVNNATMTNIEKLLLLRLSIIHHLVLYNSILKYEDTEQYCTGY